MTRRELIAGAACVAGSLGVVSAQTGIAIHDEIDIAAIPKRVYEALLDSKQFTALSGMPAEINKEAGGKFSLFEGHIFGRNVELVPDRRIVQAWRVDGWPEGVYSIAKFDFEAKGAGTHLVFDHTGFPPDLKEHLAAGWKEHYWDTLQKYFSK